MTGDGTRPAITPDLKIGALLDAYPELEQVLVEMAPEFKKLRNPVLRRTVAKLASLRQAARVGGVSLGEMIGRLRRAAGIEEAWTSEETVGADKSGRPGWLDENRLVETFDAREMIETGGHPLPVVMDAIGKLEPGQIYAIVTPFEPAPMIDKVREEGYLAWCERVEAEKYRTYFGRG
jgi:uncharacterized protein (DUF2249 family)